MQYNIHKNNFHDYFIIGTLVSALVGTVQYSLLGHAFLAGMFCLPAAIKEIHISLKQKVQPIIAFMVTFISYAIISTLWTPQQDLLLREIWNLIWNTIIFLGLFNHARYANNPNDSFLKGLRILICSTLIIAAWELTSCDMWAPECVGSVVAASRLSCPAAYGIFVSPTRDRTHIPCIGGWILNH